MEEKRYANDMRTLVHYTRMKKIYLFCFTLSYFLLLDFFFILQTQNNVKKAGLDHEKRW